MINVIINENGHFAMDKFDTEDLNALEALLKRMDSNVGISTIDYKKGIVGLSYLYNRGKMEEFEQKDFLKVNVAGESVPCAIWEVVNKVFYKCVM